MSAAKKGHFREGGAINLPKEEGRNQRVGEANKRRSAFERLKSEPVVLGWGQTGKKVGA